MNILIIGDALSQYTTNFSFALKQYDPSIDIDIINTRPVKPNEKNQFKSSAYNQTIHYQPMNGLMECLPKIRVLFRNLKGNSNLRIVKKKIDDYDVILLHGFWKQNCEIYNKLNPSKPFTVAAVWGSDFYKRSSNERMVFQMMDICDLVVISTQNMVEDITAVHHIDSAKIRNCLFGLAPLERLMKMEDENSSSAKKKLGFDPDDILITCGYNGSPNQQHLAIISSLSRILKNNPKPIKLLVPITYGGDSKYHQEIKSALIHSGLDYKIYDTFLPDEVVSYLRKATSIMLQIQQSDAFSGSMQEHLFCKNIVITGSWLPYQSLLDKNIYYEAIDDLTQLDDKLLYVIDNFELLRDKASKINTKDKFVSSLWSECIKDWYNALNEYRTIPRIS
jgi:hypothetical protein